MSIGITRDPKLTKLSEDVRVQIDEFFAKGNSITVLPPCTYTHDTPEHLSKRGPSPTAVNSNKARELRRFFVENDSPDEGNVLH